MSRNIIFANNAASIPDSDVQRFAAGGLHSIVSDKSSCHSETQKSGLDPLDIKNYRPISNLSFMSKIVEKLVAQQLFAHLNRNQLPPSQSGFRRHHSTESAILKVLADVYTSIDKGQVSLVGLLDVSAAFDTGGS